MKKALFALSLLVVAPISANDEIIAAPVEEVSAPVAPVEEVPAIPAPVEEVPVTSAPVEEVVVTPAVEVAAPVKTASLFEKGRTKISNGATFVKDGVVYSVVSAKDGVFYAYDKVTGTIEKFTPNMILNAKDSVRGAIASYPLTAVALTAFVAVKASNYFSAPAQEVEESEDDQF